MATGGTLFDFMYADDATRQAASDDPYYALRGGGGSGCANPTQIVCDQAAAQSSAIADAPQFRDGRYTRHGLRRRGLRALVDGATEIGAGGDGARRFRRATSQGEVIVSVSKDTELLVGEEIVTPTQRTKAQHTWARSKRGWVRDRTDVEEIETVGGRQVRSTAVIRFHNVRVE